MTRHQRCSLLLASLLFAACGGKEKTEATAEPARAMGRAGGPRAMSMCPAMIPGVSVSVEDTPDGAAVTFTAPPAQVADLRARVHSMAAMHERMAEMYAPEQERQPVAGHEHGPGMRGGRRMKMMTMMRLPPARVAVEDVEGGARVTLAAKDPADVDALRASAKRHVEMMRSHECPMRPEGEEHHPSGE